MKAATIFFFAGSPSQQQVQRCIDQHWLGDRDCLLPLRFLVSLSGSPFNDAYRYVDWLLTVPLLLIELILVMGLSSDQTRSLSWSSGLTSAAMVCLGYPDEIQDDPAGRWVCLGLSMIPFCFVVFQLLIGLGGATQSQPEVARGLTGQARMLTGVYIIPWCLSNLRQTDWLVHCSHCRQGRLWCAHLGHCSRQARATP